MNNDPESEYFLVDEISIPWETTGTATAQFQNYIQPEINKITISDKCSTILQGKNVKFELIICDPEVWKWDSWLLVSPLVTLTLSGLDIFNFVSFFEPFSWLFVIIGYYDFRWNHILIMILLVIWKLSQNKDKKCFRSKFLYFVLGEWIFEKWSNEEPKI